MERAKALSYAPAARDDIAAIRAYLVLNAGKRVANAVVSRIRAAISAAREMPKTGTLRPTYGPNCRFIVEQPYVIYYAYDGATMTVLRVLHGARDRDRIMGQHPPES